MLKILLVVGLWFATANAELKFSDFTVQDLDKKNVSLKRYEGKCVLVVLLRSDSENTGKFPSKRFQTLEVVLILKTDPFHS